MFVILVYDFGEKRVGKALKLCRKYLTWVQNSVFEGEISGANLKKLKIEMDKLMDKSEDSVIIYRFNSVRYSKREEMGVIKNSQDLFI
ncbi:CRISPR-associated endonuclease Cas2 [Clostridium sp. cel8]|jgi:CRISPR-associated protein Cas2|uniref:CRISPR-associated endonuclease Cas2 n=1 Tax=Clostridium sp. cel8 TaxID=2663123 RepID=UPI0015F46043|nr:CRISPR-associated endonuclease Cas2 [Clostridium sp. cel8]MBA5851228.1 CRISPR-associated endonuclease Cas2 [Clostridium sp. cel8]